MLNIYGNKEPRILVIYFKRLSLILRFRADCLRTLSESQFVFKSKLRKKLKLSRLKFKKCECDYWFFLPEHFIAKGVTSKSLFKSIVGPWQTVQSKFLSTSVYPPKHREVSQGSDQDVSVQINPATRPLGAIVREKNSPLQGLYNPSRQMILSEMNRSNSWEVSCRHHADAWH